MRVSGSDRQTDRQKTQADANSNLKAGYPVTFSAKSSGKFKRASYKQYKQVFLR